MEFDRTKYNTNISNLKDLARRIKSIIANIYEAVVPPEIKTRKEVERTDCIYQSFRASPI